MKRNSDAEPLPHVFELTVRAGEAARLIVDQGETDLFVCVTEPHGAETRYDERDRGPEYITLLPSADTTYSIEIGRVREAHSPVEYTISVVIAREPTKDDTLRVIGERASTEGRRAVALRDASVAGAALEHHLRALEVWRALGETMAEGSTLLGIAGIHYTQSRPEAAAESFAQARTAFERIVDRRGVAQALNGLGSALWQLARLDEAIRTLTLALDHWSAVGHLDGKAATLSNLGILSYEVGEWQQALELFLSARQLAHSLSNVSGEAFSCNNLAAVHNALGQRRSALTYLHLALRLFRKGKHGPAAARCLLSLGQTYLALENLKSAERLGLQAQEALAAAGDHRSLADAYRHLAQIAERRGNAEEAMARCEQALGLYRKIQNPQGESAVLHQLGVLHFRAGNNSTALRCLAQARRIRKKIGAAEGEAETLIAIARVSERRERLTTARLYAQRAIGLAEELRVRISGSDFRTSYFSSKHDYYGFLIQVLMEIHKTHPGEGADAAAFEASERGRARSLLDRLSPLDPASPSSVREDILAEARQLDQKTRYWTNRQAAALAGGNLKEGLRARQQLLALMDVSRELDSRIRASRGDEEGKPLSLLRVQHELREEGTTLLHYALADSRCYLWVITANTFASFDLGPKAIIVDAARQVYDLVSNSGRRARKPETTARWEEAVRIVSGLLMPKEMLPAGTRRLVIAADGILQYLPFAALPYPPGDVTLIERFEVACIPSISALTSLRQKDSRRERPPREILIVADPVFDADDPRVPTSDSPRAEGQRRRFSLERASGRLGRLPFSRIEAEHIAGLIPEGEVSVALGFDASEALVNSEMLGMHRILHFASHAIIDDQHPNLSSLVLSLIGPDAKPQNGLISVSRISGLRIPAELVVLSACRTGLGEDVRGEGMEGLTRAFMSAGTARLLVSLWKVDDEGASELMRHFYTALFSSRRLSPSAALRAAQLEMKADTRWNYPYYWAGFALQGEWR